MSSHPVSAPGAAGQRVSNLFGGTLRHAPAEAELASHALLLRAGYVRQVAAGIFSLLPLGWRALRKIEQILHQEMRRIGGQELLLPVVHPAELWQATGRWHEIDATLVRLRDRRERDLVLAMTHEEVVAFHAAGEIHSYRQLPALVYQVQTKVRDELRARGGLIRLREFRMKDSYSLDRDRVGLERQYQAHYDAYQRIGRRTGLPLTVVNADTGMMGGAVAHEFMYLTAGGEDRVVLCPACGYAANREVAEFRLPPAAGAGEPGVGEPRAGEPGVGAPRAGEPGAGEPPAEVPGAGAPGAAARAARVPAALEPVHTPGAVTIDQLANCLGIAPQQTAKMVFYATTTTAASEAGPNAAAARATGGADAPPAARAGAAAPEPGAGADADPARATDPQHPTVVAAVVRGDLEANLIQVQKLAGVGELRPAHADEIAATGMVPGFASPVGIDPQAAIFVVDRWVAETSNLVMGANRPDYHLHNVCCGRDYQPTVVGPVATAFPGAACSVCGGELQVSRAVEVGNLFQLGTRYAEAFAATYTDAAGAAHPIWMGSYGIGLDRLLGCLAEDHHDEQGLALPVSVAPYQVALVGLGRSDEIWHTAERVFAELTAAGLEVLYDDRRELSAGVKLTDADLRGLPLRVVIGDRSLAAGGAELSRRTEEARRIVPVDRLAAVLQEEIAALLAALDAAGRPSR